MRQEKRIKARELRGVIGPMRIEVEEIEEAPALEMNTTSNSERSSSPPSL